MMTVSGRLTRITVAALAGTLLLGGCSGQTTIVPTTASRTASSTPTASSIGAPKTADEAWSAATQTITSFVEVQYQIQASAGANPERIDPYATGSALENVDQVAAGLAEKQITTAGRPKWTPNASVSTFGVVTPQSGSAIPNGIVYVRGCFDVSDQVPKYADGSRAPVSKLRIYPVQFTVRYMPEDQTWKVDALQSIAGQQGAPSC